LRIQQQGRHCRDPDLEVRSSSSMRRVCFCWRDLAGSIL